MVAHRVESVGDEDYYLQRGYDRSGAANALSWIALNNWVAEKIATYDKDEAIMTKLIKYLHQPVAPIGIEPASKNKIENDYPSTTCQEAIEGIRNSDLNSIGPIMVISTPCFRSGKYYDDLSEGNDDSEKLVDDAISAMCDSKCTTGILNIAVSSFTLCNLAKYDKEICNAVGGSGTWSSGSCGTITAQELCTAIKGSLTSDCCTGTDIDRVLCDFVGGSWHGGSCSNGCQITSSCP